MLKVLDVIAFGLCITGAILGGIAGNWTAMIWAIVAGAWVVNAHVRSYS